MVKKQNKVHVRLIGDVHSRFKEYKKLIKDCEYSIQLGDFGFEFVDEVFHPEEFSGFGIEAGEVTLGAEADEVFFGEGRDGTAHAVEAFDFYGVSESPDFAAIFEGEAADGVGFVLLIVIDKVSTAIEDCR